MALFSQPSFLSLCAPKPWGPMGVTGSTSKSPLLGVCQWPCSCRPCAYGGKLWLCRSQLLISQCRGWLGLHCGHHPTDQRFWRSRSEIRLFCSLLEPFCVPALVCSPSGLALEHWLWHLQLGMEIACPKTQHTRVPVLRLSPSKVNPMLFCMLLLFALA